MEFYTEEDIKTMLHLGERQTRALMRTDGFPSIKIGNHYRVEVEAFKSWIDTTKSIRCDYRGVSKPVGDKHIA